ncbi:hypothetical protein SAMN04488042_105210 [Shimia aestuarii]|uniref:Uncharacterized protein n=1 Tax=Shimia aestuarii TaxID=254406 RepID=A0A1I4PFW3_9RHOB|nr:hypothetical protein SAMN04488042_105210 [Shimia aestuarii]
MLEIRSWIKKLDHSRRTFFDIWLRNIVDTGPVRAWMGMRGVIPTCRICIHPCKEFQVEILMVEIFVYLARELQNSALCRVAQPLNAWGIVLEQIAFRVPPAAVRF